MPARQAPSVRRNLDIAWILGLTLINFNSCWLRFPLSQCVCQSHLSHTLEHPSLLSPPPPPLLLPPALSSCLPLPVTLVELYPTHFFQPLSLLPSCVKTSKNSTTSFFYSSLPSFALQLYPQSATIPFKPFRVSVSNFNHPRTFL